MVLETRSLKSRGRRAGFPLQALGEGPSCLFQFLRALGIPWLVATTFQAQSLSSHGLFSVSVSWTFLYFSPFRALFVGFGLESRTIPSHLLTLITSVKTLTPHKVTIWGSRRTTEQGPYLNPHPSWLLEPLSLWEPENPRFLSSTAGAS